MTDQTPSRFLLHCALAMVLMLQPVAAEDGEREGGLTGTGIVGEITALGSIIVNDQRIVFDPDLMVTNVLSPKSASDLVPGDVVAVAVSPDGGDWTANAIRQVHALVGPVEKSKAGRITVLGVDVMWHGAVPADGRWSAVSGFWTPDGVVATRVDPIAPRRTASLVGSYRESPAGATSMVGSVVLDLEPLRHAREGDVIEVTGTIDGGVFSATDVRLGLFDAPVSFVLAEGYLTDVAPSGHYTVAGSGLSAYTTNLQSIMSPDRVRVCGVDGRLGTAGLTPETELIERLGCQAASR